MKNCRERAGRWAIMLSGEPKLQRNSRLKQEEMMKPGREEAGAREGDKDGKVHWGSWGSWGHQRNKVAGRPGREGRRAQRMRKRATGRPASLPGLLQGGSFRRRSNIALSGSVGKTLP